MGYLQSNEYRFLTRWRVQGTVEQVYDTLSRPADMVRWWPSVYLAVQELETADPDKIGKVVSLYTRGWLPYTLRWQSRVTETNYPYGFALEAWGDFVGTGRWHFEPDGSWVNITYDWRIRADRPILRYLSFLLKPIFAVNHRWAMAQGEKSLAAELARRRAARRS
ncbi:MAG: SRPBCC family protein [Candidatus Binatia bacterium]